VATRNNQYQAEAVLAIRTGRLWLPELIPGIPKRRRSSPCSPRTPLLLAYPKSAWPLTGLPKWKFLEPPLVSGYYCSKRQMQKQSCGTWHLVLHNGSHYHHSRSEQNLPADSNTNPYHPSHNTYSLTTHRAVKTTSISKMTTSCWHHYTTGWLTKTITRSLEILNLTHQII